jgi:hypothetical protein
MLIARKEARRHPRVAAANPRKTVGAYDDWSIG